MWEVKKISFGMARIYQILAKEYGHDIFKSKYEDDVIKYSNITEEDILYK